MFTFKSPVISTNIWKLCFKTSEEMAKIYFEDKEPEEGIRLHGITEYITSTIYIDKDLDGFLLVKALRHELMHIYLWETGQQDRKYTEEEVCDLISVAAPLICKTADDIVLRLK
ncbi:MAG: hypothetical protein BHW00_07080 [Clostridium sp. 26_22]|nr:MAG: hypothetical protein BHW00_07080 [Clostridium sp. 26_22]